ncbi:MAG: pyridoxal-dependent decarboxylase [Phycisphaerales bacterium JB037]
MPAHPPDDAILFDPLPEVPHLSPQRFRELGTRMVHFIADYLESCERFPVQSRAEPGDVFNAIPDAPPDNTGDANEWDAIFADLERTILPGLTHWQHPGWFAFFPANVSAPAILGEIASAGLGVQGMLWATSPACTELETRMLDWLCTSCGLPEHYLSTHTTTGPQGPTGGGGVIHGTASEATLVAMLAARARAWKCLQQGSNANASNANNPHLVAYCSDQAHSSVVKAAMIAGLARDAEDRTHLRLIETDANYALDASKLEQAIGQDLAAGRVPFFVCATLGTTSSGAFDSLAKIREVCERTGFGGGSVRGDRPGWVHVDAAWAGSALVCPEHRGVLEGVETADSLCFNPHKWLLTNFDCSLLWTRDRATLTGALSITPEYLRTRQGSSVIDYRDWQIPLGRRFRALKLWFVMRHYGLAGLRAHIARGIELARRLEALIAAEPRLELAAPRSLALLCVRCAPQPGESPDRTDARTRELLDDLNASGKVLLTHTTLPSPAGPRSTIRISIGGVRTGPEHVAELWRLIRQGLGDAIASA